MPTKSQIAQESIVGDYVPQEKKCIHIVYCHCIVSFYEVAVVNANQGVLIRGSFAFNLAYAQPINPKH